MDEQSLRKLLYIDEETLLKPLCILGYRYVSRCSCSISPSRIEARSPHVGTIVKNAALFFTVGGVKYSLPFPSPFSQAWAIREAVVDVYLFFSIPSLLSLSLSPHWVKNIINHSSYSPRPCTYNTSLSNSQLSGFPSPDPSPHPSLLFPPGGATEQSKLLFFPWVSQFGLWGWVLIAFSPCFPPPPQNRRYFFIGVSYDSDFFADVKYKVKRTSQIP